MGGEKKERLPPFWDLDGKKDDRTGERWYTPIHKEVERMRTLLKNVDTIVSYDGEDRIYKNTDLWFSDGRIERIGPSDRQADRVFDCSGMLLYPGFVNTHHHLYQYFTRSLELVQGMELFDWLRTLYEIWKNLNGDTVYLSTLAAMGELMRYGCTTCFDHHYVFPKGAGDLIVRQMEAADRLGIRFVASRGSMDLSKKDGGLPPDSVVQTIDEILADSRRLIEAYHHPETDRMHDIVLAPCSPFSVSGDLMRESASLARAYGVRLHTHVGETMDEENYTLSRFGRRPVAYMESLGWVGDDVWYAHGIHMNDAELDLLAATGTGVAHCPNSNMKLHSGVCRVPDMLKRGVKVGLAVDGSASNDGSNMMDEIRSAFLLHRLTWGEQAPTGYELLKMATAGSAALLGRSDIGSIEEGKRADCFLIQKEQPDLLCAELDPLDLFGNVGYHKPCDLVFVNGKLTVQAGQILTVDEGRLYREGRREIERLLG